MHSLYLIRPRGISNVFTQILRVYVYNKDLGQLFLSAVTRLSVSRAIAGYWFTLAKKILYTPFQLVADVCPRLRLARLLYILSSGTIVLSTIEHRSSEKIILFALTRRVIVNYWLYHANANNTDFEFSRDTHSRMYGDSCWSHDSMHFYDARLRRVNISSPRMPHNAYFAYRRMYE